VRTFSGGTFRLGAILFVLALGLRLVAIDHGLPGLYVPDTHSVRNALGMLKDRDPVPPSNRYSSYPYLFSYLCIPVFAADYAAARTTGRAASPAEYQQWASAHLDRFHFLARLVAAVGGALAAAGALAATTVAFGRRAGTWAGLLAATSPMFVLLSAHERPWSWVLACTCWSVWAAITYIQSGGLRWLVASGALAGAAAGFHQLGAGAFLVPVAAALVAPGGGLARVAGHGAAAFAALAAAFLSGNPYYIRYGLRGAEPTALTQDLTDVSVGGQGLKFVFNAQHTGEALAGIFSMEGVVCLLALAGAVLYYKKRTAWVLLAFAAPIVLFFLAYIGTHARYFVIAFPAAWVFAGAALDRLASTSGMPVAALLLIIPLGTTARLDQLLLRDDTRNGARARIEQEIPAHARVAAEPYGPPLQPDVASLEKFLKCFPDGGDPLSRRERLVLDRREPGGYDLLPLERYVFDAAPGQYTRLSAIAGRTHPGATSVSAWLDAAAPEYVVRIDRFPGVGRADALVDWIQQKCEPLFEVSPSKGGAPREALLPFEPRLGLVSLMEVDRPGPRIRVYRVKK
jgi:hypothetical protein